MVLFVLFMKNQNGFKIYQKEQYTVGGFRGGGGDVRPPPPT